MVVISADRPKHLIDIGDGQTIRQENVFENHILFSANLIENEKFKTRNSQLIGEALQVATSQKGPVHINCMFREPFFSENEFEPLCDKDPYPHQKGALQYFFLCR